jgi:putative nucleotidyltransferase with HDIG domain
VPLGVAPTQQQLRSWRGHPVVAAAIRIVAFTTPVVAALAWSAVMSRVVASPRGLIGRGLWLIGMLATSTAVLIATERLARRVLPLAALLKLSLVFPDHVPSRFSVALRTGTTRQLARKLQQTNVAPSTQAGATELLTLVAALNHHDPLTRGHSERVRALSDLLAKQLHLDEEDREKVRWVALLHDIGKLRVPGEILRKPGKPTAEEWKVLKTHPAEGVALIQGPIADWLGDWTRAIGEHHEQFDGSGYPAGLSGTDISLAGRLVAVADVFDVITATRSYKKSMTIQEGRLEITRCAGTQFDPDMVRAFLQISIGDLRKAMGPLSWLAQLSLFGRLAAAPAASTMAGTMIAVTGLGLGPVTSVYSEPVRPHRAPATQVHADTPSNTVGSVETSPPKSGSDAPGSATTQPGTSSAELPVDQPVTGSTSVPDEPLPASGTPTSATTAGTPVVATGPGTTQPNGPVISVPSSQPTSLPISVPATSVPTISVPPISVPAISVPPISVPPISVPPITLPVITLPIVTVPISIPPITLPVITVPVITLPVITLPVITVPPITLPKIHL